MYLLAVSYTSHPLFWKHLANGHTNLLADDWGQDHKQCLIRRVARCTELSDNVRWHWARVIRNFPCNIAAVECNIQMLWKNFMIGKKCSYSDITLFFLIIWRVCNYQNCFPVGIDIIWLDFWQLPILTVALTGWISSRLEHISLTFTNLSFNTVLKRISNVLHLGHFSVLKWLMRLMLNLEIGILWLLNRDKLFCLSLKKSV